MCGKVFALGFVPYLRDPWNILDFVVVLVGWVSSDYPFLGLDGGEGSGLLGTSVGSVGGLRTLRTFRALRPLRTIQRMPGMRLVVMVLFECAPVFINICFIVFFFFTVFAIMGVQFFAGRFWTCNDTSVRDMRESRKKELEAKDRGTPDSARAVAPFNTHATTTKRSTN